MAREDGTIFIAHDLGDLDVVDEILIAQQDGALSVRIHNGSIKSLGNLKASMLAYLRPGAKAFVIVLDGWKCHAPMECTLSLA